MPTIEISQKQAEALARGESITVSTKRYIVVLETGNVYEVKNPGEPLKSGWFGPDAQVTTICGVCKLLSSTTHHSPVGTSQMSVCGKALSITELPSC
jgi:hypothetical protein